MVTALSRPRLMLAALLAVLAGYLDGCGFVYLGGYFVSFMSGNTTRLGVDIANIDGPAVLLAAALIVAFVLGAMAGTALWSPGTDRSPLILGLITAALALAALLATPQLQLLAGSLFSFAMGMANTVLGQRGEASFGVTYMTGALVKVGQGAVAAVRGVDRWGWARHLLLWASMALGALSGAIAFGLVAAGSFWIGAAAAGVLTIVAVARRLRR